MTKELFRDDSYLKTCQAKIIQINLMGGILLDQTVFFPTGGGQIGDSGTLHLSSGEDIVIATTIKKDGQIIHVPEKEISEPIEGMSCEASIDWARRFCLMQLHTSLHILCSLVPCAVTGGQIGDGKARLDFDMADHVIDKENLTAEINRVILEDHPVSVSWIDAKDLDMSLVRTIDVAPPSRAGKIRLVKIGDIDLQPCGGTHVGATGEIKALYVAKIESKGKRNKRVVLKFLHQE